VIGNGTEHLYVEFSARSFMKRAIRIVTLNLRGDKALRRRRGEHEELLSSATPDLLLRQELSYGDVDGSSRLRAAELALGMTTRRSVSERPWWWARHIRIGALAGLCAAAAYFGAAHLFGFEVVVWPPALIGFGVAALTTWVTRPRQ
jgi:hypothetical protein